MQVANDVASAKELPTREARPGRRVNNSAAESCRAASSARIASRALWSAVLLAESAAFVAYEASSVASAFEELLVATTPSTSKADWSALFGETVVSKLCSAAMLLPCAATCPSVVARAAAVARPALR